ncbi:hypothetical protein GCM10022381_07590 [Leifsonia kafniensis]|uniref:YtxH domain-containing protein n=1 Tax=Leifsonia kafniensis TaxID=475957 RepID=A0ABP7K678_9MICO
MKNFIWLVVGVAAGFVVAHEVNKTQQGKQFFSDLDAKAREFGEAMSDGYRQREAELRAALGDGDAPTASSSVPFSGPSSFAKATTNADSAVDIEAEDAAFDAAAADSAADSAAASADGSTGDAAADAK